MEPETLNLPVLALRGLTVFPHTNLTFDVERHHLHESAGSGHGDQVRRSFW